MPSENGKTLTASPSSLIHLWNLNKIAKYAPQITTSNEAIIISATAQPGSETTLTGTTNANSLNLSVSNLTLPFSTTKFSTNSISSSE